MKKMRNSATLSSAWSDREMDMDHNQRITELTKYIFQPIHEFTIYKNPAVAKTMLTACQVDGKPHAVDLARYEQMLRRVEEYPLASELHEALHNIANLLSQTDDHARLLANIELSIGLINQELTNLNEHTLAQLQSALAMLQQDVEQCMRDGMEIPKIQEQLNILQENTTNSLQVQNLKNTEQDTRLEHLEASLTSMEANLIGVPVGYIYQQFPGTLPPEELWIGSKWRLFTDLAGTFPRFEGGLASKFESGAQQESVPNIHATFPSYSTLANNSTGAITSQSHTLPVPSNTLNANYQRTYTFDASKSNAVYGRREEVAPKNITIRVWECIESNVPLVDDEIQEPTEEGQESFVRRSAPLQSSNSEVFDLINRVNQLEEIVKKLQS